MFCVTKKSQHDNHLTKYENVFVKGLCERMAHMHRNNVTDGISILQSLTVFK
jgi:hypothetical protein